MLSAAPVAALPRTNVPHWWQQVRLKRGRNVHNPCFSLLSCSLLPLVRLCCTSRCFLTASLQKWHRAGAGKGRGAALGLPFVGALHAVCVAMPHSSWGTAALCLGFAPSSEKSFVLLVVCAAVTWGWSWCHRKLWREELWLSCCSL